MVFEQWAYFGIGESGYSESRNSQKYRSSAPHEY